MLLSVTATGATERPARCKPADTQCINVSVGLQRAGRSVASVASGNAERP